MSIDAMFVAVPQHFNGSAAPASRPEPRFRLYERFRPEVPAGAAGWGKKGVLDLKQIENAQP